MNWNKIIAVVLIVVMAVAFISGAFFLKGDQAEMALIVCFLIIVPLLVFCEKAWPKKPDHYIEGPDWR